MSKYDYTRFFPHDSVRAQQGEAIDFTLDSFLEYNKKFVILELGTGCGKSAIGVTVARYINSLQHDHDDPHLAGAYTLTTQKVLQQQYINDFGPPKGGMLSIQSATNYRCKFYPNNNCGESLRLLKGEKKGTPFWNQCIMNCCYKSAKKRFIEAKEGVTNFSYFLAETMYGGQLKPRKLLVVDEAHNTEKELSKFVEITISEKFATEALKLEWPTVKSQNGVVKWVKETYIPRVKSHITHINSMLEKFKGLKERLEEFVGFAKQYDMLDKHICKVVRFLEMYSEDNWVMNMIDADGRSMRKFEFKPVDVGPYSHDLLFKFGENVILMSATIVNRDVFCDSLGIPLDDVMFLSIDSPFPVENRPIVYVPAGSMAKDSIDVTLPKMVEMIKVILDGHKGEKGIIHTHTFKIANYIKKHIRSRRLIIHDSTNRDEMVKKHMESEKDTVLISPSLSEGIDLKDDLSRWQVICKVPFPFLGDKLVRKRMHKNKQWYPYQTAKSIVQGVGRSVRNMDDTATTYILDSSWKKFYDQNRGMFPKSFKNALQK